MSASDEVNPLLLSGGDIHRASLEEVLEGLETSSEGMKTEVVRKKRTTCGDNTVPPPLSAPAWLCCLLPCLLRTKSMEQYKECVPQSAQVKRNGRPWVNMEATGILPGDIVKVSKDERVAADLRVIEAKGSCSFDTAAVTGRHEPQLCNPALPSKDYLQSPNMAFCGYLCISGECTGVVVATGADTVMGKLVSKAAWPPKGY
jgi:hypothetical protein